MTRWWIIAALVALAGCRSKSETCDVTKPPTKAWAYQALRAAGAEKVAHEDGLEFYEDGFKGLWSLTYDPGPDQGVPLLGLVRNCKVYRDRRSVIPALLAERGWATAKPDERTKLAHDLYQHLITESLVTPPKRWDATYTFAPAQLTASPDGSVKLVHWVATDRTISYSESPRRGYEQQEVTFAPDGSVAEPKRLTGFEPKPSANPLDD